MTHLRNAFSVARWILALTVAYGCVHVAAGTLTKLLLDYGQFGEVDFAAPSMAAIGGMNLVAAFGLLAKSRSLQVISAVVLMLSSIAPLAGIPVTSVPTGLVFVATVFALLVQVPLEPLLSGAVSPLRRYESTEGSTDQAAQLRAA